MAYLSSEYKKYIRKSAVMDILNKNIENAKINYPGDEVLIDMIIIIRDAVDRLETILAI